MTPPPAPRLSVVMSTRNRGQALPRSLAALAASRTTLPWELVVVDNGSTDDTGRVLDEFRAGARFELRIIEQRRAGLSRARNAGLEAARGEIVCFTDDDCYVQPDFLDAMSGVFDEQELGYVGGRVLLFDPADAPITIQPSESRRDLPPRSYIAVGTIHGANFAFRRTVLERVGGFDVRLGAGTSIPSGEDVDMLSRASAAGFAGAYDPRPTVLHHHGRRGAGELERLRRGYALGCGAYYLKCLLDGRRRATVVRPMLRNLRRSLVASLRHPRELEPRLQELEGALRYCAGAIAGGRS